MVMDSEDSFRYLLRKRARSGALNTSQTSRDEVRAEPEAALAVDDLAELQPVPEGSQEDEEELPEGWSRRALALTVTIQVGRHSYSTLHS